MWEKNQNDPYTQETNMPCYFKPGGVSCLNRSCFRFGFGIIALHECYLHVHE